MTPRFAMRTFWNIFLVSGIPDEHAEGCRIVCVTRIVQLWAIADERQNVHLGSQFDVYAGARDAVFKGKPAFGRHWYVHEEVDVGREISLPETVAPGQHGFHETLTARVHVTLLDRIPNHVAFHRTCAAQCVMPP